VLERHPGPLPCDEAEWDALALETVREQRAAGRFVPGLGHHVHKDGDPRTPRLMEIAAEEGPFGPHLSLFAAIGRTHPQVLGKTLPLNGAGVCGAALADLDLPIPLLRGFALLARTAGLLGQLAEEWGPEAPRDSEAKSLAQALFDTIPVIYGAGTTASPAQRWKTQINENAKQPAFVGVLPEADHNDICAWGRAEEFGRFSAVLLDDDNLQPRLRRRLELTAPIAGARSHIVASRGQTALERVLSLVFLGDLVSVYAAVLAGVDPTPVDVLERFKQDLAQ
jgi:hypothetical protein